MNSLTFDFKARVLAEFSTVKTDCEVRIKSEFRNSDLKFKEFI